MVTAILVFVLFFITACVYVFGFHIGCKSTSKLIGNIVIDAIRECDLQIADKDALICKILKALKTKV